MPEDFDKYSYSLDAEETTNQQVFTTDDEWDVEIEEFLYSDIPSLDQAAHERLYTEVRREMAAFETQETETHAITTASEIQEVIPAILPVQKPRHRRSNPFKKPERWLSLMGKRKQPRHWLGWKPINMVPAQAWFIALFILMAILSAYILYLPVGDQRGEILLKLFTFIPAVLGAIALYTGIDRGKHK